MKKCLFLIIILLSGCQKKPEILMSPLRKDHISGEILWNRIKYDSPYDLYSFWPGHEGLHPGQSPHGPIHKIYVNSTLLKALPIVNRKAPNGTIIVKENFSTDEILEKVTVMAKIEGVNDSGWFWAAYTPEGEVLAEGEPKGCFSCHSGMRDNDFIIVHALDKQ